MSGTVTDVITGESIISVDAPYGWTVERQGTAKAQISAMHRGVGLRSLRYLQLTTKSLLTLDLEMSRRIRGFTVRDLRLGMR